MVEKKDNRKFFELRNGMKAVDFRNKDYYDQNRRQGKKFIFSIYDYEICKFCIWRSVLSRTLCGNDQRVCEQTSVHSVQQTQKTVLDADCHVWILKQQFHPWVKPMKKTANKSHATIVGYISLYEGR
jgi:hypothetical protein